ncbi:MAG: ABC transporter transmembrane domain-containing protein [Enterocloster sp.]
MRHIAALPLGVTEKYGSGKLRRIVNTFQRRYGNLSCAQAARQSGRDCHTDRAAFPCCLLFDWRLGLLSLVPVVLGFLIMMKMTGAGMEQKMKEYQNALSDMSNEAVEYVRGIPVVKTFRTDNIFFQTLQSAIDNYEKWVIAYTKALRLPMMFYTTAINGVFAFLIAGRYSLYEGRRNK